MSREGNAGNMTNNLKYISFDADPCSAHNLVVSLIPPSSRVLEFGCATGYMSEILKNTLNCSVIGVELMPEAGEQAKEFCERVVFGDVELLDFSEVFGGDSFDTVIFADVLEHLKNPDTVLRRIRPFLTEGGCVIASIPNIAHGSVRLSLLSGVFRYQDTGLLDNTHIRFFTRDTIQDMFEESGFFITHWLRRRMAINHTEIPIPQNVPPSVEEWVSKDPEATTYQFIVRAIRNETGDVILRQRRELETANINVAELNRQMEKLKDIINEKELTISMLTNSRGWRLLQRLWRIRSFFIPQGSLRKKSDTEFIDEQ